MRAFSLQQVPASYHVAGLRKGKIMCRLANVPISPISDSGGADTSQLMRTFAALAPSWRLGVNPGVPLPACVGPLNVTYLDFQRNDSFYIG